MNLKNETYLSGDFLRLLFLSLSDLTNLPPPCKRNRFREDTLTFNHIQLQDTRIYLLKLVVLVKAFSTLQQSCDCTFLWDWSNSKETFKRYIIYNMAEVKVRYIWESRLTSTLELDSKDSLIEILWRTLSSKPVTSFTNFVSSQNFGTSRTTYSFFKGSNFYLSLELLFF